MPSTPSWLRAKEACPTSTERLCSQASGSRGGKDFLKEFRWGFEYESP